jgi:enterochelin esterase-like enzyme
MKIQSLFLTVLLVVVASERANADLGGSGKPAGKASAIPKAEASTPLERNDTSNWYPFTFPLDDTNLDSIDLTSFLDAPAGKHGFLAVRDDGHFYFQDGTRARFFGTNVAGATAIPTSEQAPILAARLAKYGVNMLRIHAIDGRWAGNFIDYKRGDTRHLSADMLDRLGFFVRELKKRGIYVYLDLLDYRRFLPADGVRDAAQLQEPWQNSIKGASTFNERMIELQKEYAGQFLTYRNPHTGLRFVDDPAVAVVEITNENSVFYTHNTSLMLPSYVEELRQHWNRWLVEKFGTRDALAKAWTNAKGECALLAAEDPAQGTVVLPMKYLYQDPAKAPFVGEQSPVRVDAMVRFFFELQRGYYAEMREHLKSLGVKVPITGTNQTFCPASNYADAVNDFMSRNNYWLHPNVQAKPMFTFRNLPMVGSDLAATSNPIVEVASSAVAGRPMISPEFNFPWPNEHRAECLPLMAAYACLQDWDGLLFYNYRPDRKSLEMFGSQSDPVRWGQFPAAALLFHRQDVSVAKNTVPIGYSEEEIFTARPSHGRAKTSPYRHFAYLSKVRNVYGGQSPNAVPGVDFRPPAVPDEGYTSDTGELNLNPARRLFTIRTARTKAAVGFLGQAGPIDLDGVTVHCRTPFAAILVTSLEDRPIVQSRRLLVTAVARAENSGQAFDSNKSRVPQVGQLPVIVEPVDGVIELKRSAAATLYPLDETGKRRKAIPVDFDQDTCRLRLTDLRSPWCEVEFHPVSGTMRRDTPVEPVPKAPSIDKMPGVAWIVAYPATGPEAQKLAATELADYVGRATGVVAKVVAERELPRPDAADAYVGATARARALELYREGLDPESYVIQTHGGELFIYGDDAPGNPLSNRVRTGTLSGVYGFLEDYLGVTWIWPGKTGEVVPRREGLQIAPIHQYSKPGFAIRSFTYGGGELGPWLKRMKQGWVTKGWFGHSWTYHYFKKGMDKAHPEWMALWGGRRRGPHLCTSNQALRDSLVQSVIDTAEKSGDKIVSISPSDGYGFCECENCRQLDPPGTDYALGAATNLSNRHWDYANYIAREVQKRRPDLGVGMFAYVSYHEPPTNIYRFEDNLYVSFTLSAAYFVKPQEKQNFYRMIEGFGAKGAKVVAREYWGMHYWLNLPYLFTKEIAESMPWFHDRGVVAMYGENDKNFGTQGPVYYLVSHLMWDPKADPAQILDRFYGAFGPAAHAVRRYYETFEDSVHTHQDRIPDFRYLSLINAWPEIFPPQEIVEAGQHLEEARRAVAGNAELEAKLKVVEIGYEYTQTMVELLGLYRTLGRAGVPLWFFGYEGDVEQFASFYKLPEGMPPEYERYWAAHPRVDIPPEEKLKLLRRAKHLGEERQRILRQYDDLPAVSLGLYASTLKDGVRPWHQTVVKELEKLEPARPVGPMAVRREGDKIVITSSAGPTWKAAVDGKHGGVITALRIPADGNNLASDDGSRFEGLCNLIYVDFQETGKDGAYVAKGSLYYFGATERLSILEEQPDRIVVEVTGRAGNQVTPKADVLRYRQRYTFLVDRIVCEGEVDWMFDDVTPGSRPELIQLNNVFAPGAVEGEMSVWDADTGAVPLPQTNSKGRNYPEGINYPLTVQVPLRGGHALRFHSLQMPDDLVQARFYWNEFPRQIENKRGFAFKAWEGWPGNGNVSFPNDEPIAYRYEIVFVARADATRGSAGQQEAAQVPLRTPPRPQPRWLDTQRSAPPGTRLSTFFSRTIGQEVSYLLYLPPDYETNSQRRYPVLYWLHGRGGTQYTGADFVVPYLDAAIRQGEAPAMIAIMVNGLVDGFYSDSPDGRFPIESVIIKDLIPHVDATYRTVATRQGRAVQGYSMGGWGAAHLGFKYSDLFGAVCIDAGALLEPQALRERHPDIFDRMFGAVDNYLANHPRTLIEKNADKVRRRTFIRIGVGDEDQLLGVNRQYHELLTTLGIEHEYEVVPGVAHFNRDYHRVLGAKGFAFYRKAFAGLEP